jgi:hypothetical protein
MLVALFVNRLAEPLAIEDNPFVLSIAVPDAEIEDNPFVLSIAVPDAVICPDVTEFVFISANERVAE